MNALPLAYFDFLPQTVEASGFPSIISPPGAGLVRPFASTAGKGWTRLPAPPTNRTMDTNLRPVLDDTITRLIRAGADKRSPWRLPVLSTVSAEAGPQARIVVLRAFDPSQFAMTIFTDARTPKVLDIAADPRVSLLFWDKAASVQLRVGGTAAAHTEGAAVDAAKARLSAYPGADYARYAIPGSAASDPEDARARLADGLAHFALVEIIAHQLDWLDLSRDGHRRAAFTRAGTDWTGHWTVP